MCTLHLHDLLAIHEVVLCLVLTEGGPILFLLPRCLGERSQVAQQVSIARQTSSTV